MAKAKAQAGNAIGVAVRQQRESVGMTVTELAAAIGVSRNTLTNYEAGNTEPSATELGKLSDKLGCELGDLVGRVRSSPVPKFAFRAHAHLRRDSEVTVLARKYLQSYAEIEELTETRLKDRLRGYTSGSSNPQSEREIEAIAEDLRQGCGLHDCGPENIAKVLESL